jgi:hypothetical protein
LWDGSRAARGEPNCLNCGDIFIIHTQFTNVTAGRGLEFHALRYAAACWMLIYVTRIAVHVHVLYVTRIAVHVHVLYVTRIAVHVHVLYVTRIAVNVHVLYVTRIAVHVHVLYSVMINSCVYAYVNLSCVSMFRPNVCVVSDTRVLTNGVRYVVHVCVIRLSLRAIY